MNNFKKTVALISGGEGREHEISLLSAKNLYALIDRSRYEVLDVFIDKDGAWYIREDGRLTPTFPTRLGEARGFISGSQIRGVAAAVPCLHGDLGEDGYVQGVLRLAGIPYVGQDVYASALTQDKIYTKLVAKSLGIPTADFIFLDGESTENAAKAVKALGYPLIIKPSRLGSSYGIRIVRREDEFAEAYKYALSVSKRLLIEKLISFDYELECAYFLGSFAPWGRILKGGSFYDFKAKYGGEAKTESRRGADPEAEKRAVEYSSALTYAIGIHALSRIDFFVTCEGEIYFNEINAFPGMTDTSLYPRLTEELGFKTGEFINLLIEDALS